MPSHDGSGSLRRVRRTAVISVLAVALGLIGIAGCGSSKHAATPTSTTLPAGLAAYTHCLSVHGIAPSTATPPTTVATTRAAAAISACAAGLPTPGAAIYRYCVLAYGVAPSGKKLNKVDPHYPLAVQACSALKKGGSGKAKNS